MLTSNKIDCYTVTGINSEMGREHYISR